MAIWGGYLSEISRVLIGYIIEPAFQRLLSFPAEQLHFEISKRLSYTPEK